MCEIWFRSSFNYFWLKFKYLKTKISSSQNVSTSRNAHPLTSQDMQFYDKFVDRFQDLSKVKILLPARQRSNNYLELSKENVLGNVMVSHWMYFTWKFFMIWSQKILKLIFQKQPSCPRNICTEDWKKLPKSFFLKFCIILQNHET